MSNEKAKEDLKFAGHELKDAAAAAADGVKETGRTVKDEVKEIADGEDK